MVSARTRWLEAPTAPTRLGSLAQAPSDFLLRDWTYVVSRVDNQLSFFTFSQAPKDLKYIPFLTAETPWIFLNIEQTWKEENEQAHLMQISDPTEASVHKLCECTS